MKIDRPGHAWLIGNASGITADLLRGEALSVEGPVAPQHLLAACILARDLDGAFVGFRPAEAEKCLLKCSGRNLGQFFAQSSPWIGGDTRVHITDLFDLFLDGLDHLAVAVSDIDVHQLRIEVKVALAAGVPEIDPIGAYCMDRVNSALHSP